MAKKVDPLSWEHMIARLLYLCADAVAHGAEKLDVPPPSVGDTWREELSHLLALLSEAGRPNA